MVGHHPSLKNPSEEPKILSPQLRFLLWLVLILLFIIPLSDLNQFQFRYATTLDVFLILLGSLCAAVNGVGFPIMSLVLGGMSDAFIAAQNSDFAKNNRDKNLSYIFLPTNFSGAFIVEDNFSAALPSYSLPKLTASEFEGQVAQYALYYVYIGFIIMLTSYLQVFLMIQITDS